MFDIPDQRPPGYKPRHRRTTVLPLSPTARRIALAVAGVAVRHGPVAVTAIIGDSPRVRPAVGSVGTSDVGFE